MADAARGLGSSSLPVANVQALAESCNDNGADAPVPGRYLIKDPSAEEVVAAGDSACAIPVIDFRKLLDPGSSEEECARLGAACHHWGFFQLINHGVPAEVTGNLMKDVAGFFRQPLEAKKECAQQAGSIEGYGQAFVVSEDQKLDWADMLFLIVRPREARDMRFWPTRPESFRDSVDAYSLQASKLAYRLLEFMARGVGADPASLQGMFQGQVQGMRVNYYPPCQQAADQVLGLSPHSDPNGLTLLLQMSHDVHGLQVSKDGRWFPVQALPGAFVVNVGDALEVRVYFELPQFATIAIEIGRFTK
ncbi:Protein SRG1 [Zea mays]|uniref:Protein SRG1 n=1 Tax=Zea mays TaxID=4577 RepID=A0A317YGT7_MAIZE|nr:Protein SRG1 [Zea mays]